MTYREDSECGLLTVGSWYAMTGYGFAMPKNSKYLEKFNKKMIEYRESGLLSLYHTSVYIIHFKTIVFPFFIK